MSSSGSIRHLCVLGLQWGDEGKGKIVDVLTAAVDVVVRYQGGANAGHTIIIEDVKHVLHHLPSGVLRAGVQAVLGNGMVIETEALLAEVDQLDPEVVDRLHLSDRAHLVLPFHRELDRARESNGCDTKIGTTLRGIGPAYEDKVGRRGVRLGDLREPSFLDDELPARLAARGFDAELIESSVAVCRRLVERLGSRIGATDLTLDRLHREGRRFLFEGAQGCLLDVDFGTYPFVTSSSPSFLGIGSGSGFSPRKVDHVLGVTKVYCTRVGEGPFPTEADPEAAAPLREAGGEFGATTGRPRRCGWLDLPALEYAIRVNDVDSLALTKADVLNGRATVPVAVGYELDGERIDGFPSRAEDLDRVRPIYEEWPGWDDVDAATLAPFVERLSARLGVPVSIISTGRRRDEVIVEDPLRSFVEGER
ncbi:MAG: adenylosuccinate synthase [Planctomycetes bacterium]|nr:adenylosuccinate synthase [Planctomycetota bacterium]